MNERARERERRREKMRKEDERKQKRELFLKSSTAEPGDVRQVLNSSGHTEPVAIVNPEVTAGEFTIEAAAGDVVKMRLYGYIYGSDMLVDFADKLEAAAGKPVEIAINSGGGSVFIGIGLYNQVASYKGKVTMVVEGVAASAATLFAMAGDEIKIAENAMWMIHKSRGSVTGTAEQIREYIELLEKANNSLLLTYAARTGISRAELERLTSKDTWMSAAEAKAGGWVDAVIESKKVKPHVAPKSEAVTAEQYDAAHYREFIEQVETLAASVGHRTTKEPAATAGKQQKEPTMKKKFSEWLSANGFDPATQTEAQLTALRLGWRAECGDEAEDDVKAATPVATVGDDQDAIWRRQAAARYRRQAEIDAKLGEFPALAAKAIEENWDAGRIDAEVALHRIRSQRATGPIVNGGGDGAALTSDVLTCSLLQAIGSPAAATMPQPVQEAAQKRFGGRINLQRLLLEDAWAKGYDRNIMRISSGNVREVLKYCDLGAGPQASGGFSTLGITGILGNTANKAIMEMFRNVDSTWREISAIGSTTDFKLVTRYRLLGMMEYDEIGKGGEIPHGGLTEESHTEKIKTYGKMAALTREDIINDDLGALNEVVTAIVNGAALKLNTVFWTKFLDNSSFFTSARGNLLEGTAYVLAAAGLQKAVQMFREMKLPGHGADTTSHPLGVAPKLLLVPPALETTASELYVSTTFNTGGSSTSTKVPNRNVFAGLYRPIVSAYLSAAFALTGYSDTAYYLLADPMQAATIKTLFLDGRQTPMVDSADADFNVLGIQLRGVLDFGVVQTEHRGGVKVTGVASA